MKSVYEALSHPVRRKILKLLRQSDCSAGELAEHFDLSKSTMSGHFTVLKAADLVTTVRSGTTITYRLNVSVLEEAILALMEQFNISGGENNTHDS